MTDAIHIRQKIDRNALRWPDEKECAEDGGLGRNRAYIDMRGLSFEDVEPLIRSEQDFARLIEQGMDYDDALDLVDENPGDRFHAWFFDLEPGVASSVVALSAFGCIPFASCNGGFFGGSHLETMPLVAFYAGQDQVTHLLDSATATGVGLVNDRAGMGAIVLFSNDIAKLQAFARHLSENSGKTT